MVKTRAHVLAIPYPAQGHVMPLMEATMVMVVNHGIQVTFVNTELNHDRVLQSLTERNVKIPELLKMVSISDGIDVNKEYYFDNLVKSYEQDMPKKLESLINDINNGGGEKITCVIADETMGWTLEVAEKMGIEKKIIFWPLSALTLALMFSFQRLIDDGIIDTTGSILEENARMVQLSPEMPLINPEEFLWIYGFDETTRKFMFRLMERANRTVKKANWVICNTSEALEKVTLNSFPQILPVGPPLFKNRLGSFWPEDHDCLKWLNQQPPQSVVYVAFGSITVLNRRQFRELALGLELSNKPFLWVVRPDLLRLDSDDDDAGNDDVYPAGFRNRVLGIGRISNWVPQQEVLSHPSLACFVSHCGWNSTMEGISNGLPFLCWPYIGDQSLNRKYICDVWNVGLGFTCNENGIIESEEIKNKIDQVIGDERFRKRALELKTGVLDHVKENGSSSKNFMNVINSIIE